MAFERFDPPEISAEETRIWLMDKTSDGDWMDVGSFPDTPNGAREAESLMHEKESTTGYCYKIVRRTLREETIVSWT